MLKSMDNIQRIIFIFLRAFGCQPLYLSQLIPSAADVVILAYHSITPRLLICCLLPDFYVKIKKEVLYRDVMLINSKEKSLMASSLRFVTTASTSLDYPALRPSISNIMKHQILGHIKIDYVLKFRLSIANRTIEITH